jgi:hypothetical protein
MQYKVPQNVDIEDKVIAGLTLRQFMFLMVSGGLCLLENFALIGSLRFLFMPLAVLTGALGVSLAFVKINDRPFEHFLVSAGKTILTPSKRVWDKEVALEKDPYPVPVKEDTLPKKKSVGELKSNLERLAMVVDSGGVHEWDEDDPRLAAIKVPGKPDPQKVEDILERTEKPSERLAKFFDKAKKEVAQTKKEPTIAAVATKKTKPTDFEYENIELANERKLDEILEKTEEAQKEKEEKIKEATVKKTDRTKN